MQHEIENSNQTDVEATVRAFIETDLTRELQALRLSFRQPLRDWFTDTRDAILRLKKDDERHYQQTIDLLSDKLPELRTIIESIESESWYSKFESSITQVATSLPEVIQENQTDAHLNSAKSDSIYVKTGKFIKRIKQKVGGKPLRRTVYVRQLFLQHVTSSEEWIKDFAAREYDEYAMLLDLLLEKTDEQPETQENEDSEKKKRKTDFKFQIFSELEEHLHVAVQHLKQVEQNNEEHVKKLIETFATDLITKCHAAGTFQLPQKKLSAEIQTRLPEEPFVKQRKEWGRFLMSQYSDLKIQVEIARYGFLASIAKEDILRHTHEFFRDSFYLPIEQAVNSIRSGVKQIDEMKENSAVVKKLESLREDLLKEMDEKVLEPMRDTDRIMAPVRHIENVLSDLQADSSQFSDELNLARKRESSYPVPHVEMDTIRWQSLAARFMNEEAVKKLDPSLQQFDKLLSDVISTAEEAVQIVDVNLLAATESTLKENAPDQL